VPTRNVHAEMMKLAPRERNRVHHESPGVRNGLTRSQRRSIFFPGIADAMAEQWGGLNAAIPPVTNRDTSPHDIKFST
jgi:hypothetical protein